MAGGTVTVKVKGLRELNSALKRYDRALQKDLEVGLREAAQAVADNARSRFSAIDSRSAGGFRPRLRGFGRVVVEQRYRRTTGKHPEFGSLQMRRALLPAMREEEPVVIKEIEHLLDVLGREEGF